MRRGLWPIPAIVLLTACSSGPQRPWPYHEQLAKAVPACPEALHHEPPLLAGVTAYGLEGPQYWFPGSVIKVNWVEQNAGTMELAMKEVGSASPTYRLTRQASPSNIALPGPGCWELSLTYAGRSETTYLRVLPNRPIALLADGNRIADEAQVKRLLDSLPLSGPVDRASFEGRPSYWLDLQGLHGYIDEVQYFPTYQGRQAVLALDGSILQGSCLQIGEIGRSLPKEVAAELDQALAGLTPTARRFGGRAGLCDRFTPGS